MGLNTFIRTVTGAFFGGGRRTFYLDKAVLPMILCASATAMKAGILFVLHLFFSDTIPVYSLTGLVFWVELLLNTIIAPFLFGFLQKFRPLLMAPEED
jgi:rod shape-determining protein MreD